MSADWFWENRAGIVQGPITAQRAAELYAEAEALPHGELKGTVAGGFRFYAAYHESCGRGVLVRVDPLPPGFEPNPPA